MGWLNRLSNLWRRDALNRELDEELGFHLDSRTRDNLRAGMSPEAARLDARRRFGNRTLAQERSHDADILTGLESLGRDVLYAFRSLRKSPGFAAVAVLTLALGIGANTAVFTVVNGVLLRPLPFAQPERLLLISYLPVHDVFGVGPGMADGYYLEFARRNRSFERVTTFGQDSATLTGAGEAVRLRIATVTPDFFAVLKSPPALGRAFLPEEERGHPVVILGDAIWRNRFGGDASILGRTIMLDGTGQTVIGVMPPGFAFPHLAEIWMPLAVGGTRNSFFRPVVGRLKPDVSPEQAAAEWESLAQHMPLGRGERRSNMRAEMAPLKDLLVAGIRKSLLIFMGAVAFVLLIACANVANLLLMRGAGRQNEIAVRAALGASRGRLIRQLLTESSVVSLCGALAGIALAFAGVPALLALAPTDRIPRSGDIRIDAGVLAFALALGAGTGVLFGFVPALQTTGLRLRDFLNRGGRSATPRRERVRSVLVVWEIALALVLLAGAGLMLKSFLRMRAVDPGFRPENLTTASVNLPNSVYRTTGDMQAYHKAALERLSHVPGTIAVGAVNWAPFRPALVRGDFHRADGLPLPHGYLVDKPAVSPDYFRAVGIRLTAGRAFTESDSVNAPGVAIVTQSVARTLWPGGDPLGKRLTLEDDPQPRDWLTIVGVVEDVRQQRLTEHPHPAIYQPYEQVTRTSFLNTMTFVVRSWGDSQGLAAAIRAVFADVDRTQPVQIAAMTDLIAATTAEPWFQARLIAVFSVLALLLSAIGTYGVLAYAVAERTREIGIRMALGAEQRDVTRMVLDRSLLLAGAGVALGLAGSLVATRILAKLLYDVKPTDPATLALAAAVLATVAVIAGWLPARRAARVDPLVALRCE